MSLPLTIFDIVLQTGGLLPDKSRLQEDRGGGFIIPFKKGEGATIYLDRRGFLNPAQNFVKNNLGTVFLHEAVGHGHPFFRGKEARDINLQYSPFTSRYAHGGYVNRIKW